MELWNYLAGGAALGFVASCWSRIKGAVWRVASFAVQRVEIHSEPAHDALVAHLFRTCQRSRLYERMYGAMYEHHRDGRFGLVPYEQFGMRSVIFWAGRYPVIFRNAVEERASSTTQRNNNSDDEATKVFSTLTFLRGTFDVEKALAEACQSANELSWSVGQEQEQGMNRFVIHYVPAREDQRHNQQHHNNGLAWYQQGFYRLLSHKPEQLGKGTMHEGRALDNLIFPERVKLLINEIELWRTNREWYVDKGIPWKRGWLLYGPPGTGRAAVEEWMLDEMVESN